MSGLPRHLSASKALEARSAAAHRAEPSRVVRKRAVRAEAGIDTLAIRGGREPDPTTGAILTPIYQSTTYAQDAVGVHKGHTYSRASNPTVSALEDALGALENTPPAVCFSTGLAAITTLFLALLKAGDHIVVSDVVYGGTVRLLNLVLEPLGITASFVDTSDVQAVEDAITPRTRLVFAETPANPTLKLVDVEAIARITKKLGIPLAVDNTFLTPVLFRPLDLGADIAVYSTTKYIEGHNATVGGSISTRDARLLDRLRLFRKSLGSIQAPFDAWLTLKGLKTLPLRIRQHSRSALRVARYLEGHPKVTKVFYPGLSEFPQHDLALRQSRSQFAAKRSTKNADSQTFFGGIVAFEVAGGVDSGVTVMNNVQLCTLAENLGATETLITHPVSMTHGDVPREQRERTGITDGLIRLSVGLEDAADIIADLEQALDQVVTKATTRATSTRTTTTVKTRGCARQLV
ncbi:MAG: PLP-dependent transferase [Phycisphaeraceae bacterium]|nr:PLP-dependent transferase [Phycisphaeraceae bacterium]